MSNVSGVSGLESSIYASLSKVRNEEDDDSLVINNDDSVAEQAGTAAVETEVSANENGIANLQDQIDQAISDALQNLDKDSSATEVMNAIRNAVDSTLQANGIDPSEMKDQMQPPKDGQPGQPPEDGGLGAKIDELLTENGFDAEAIKAEMMAQGDPTAGFVNALAEQEGVDALV